MLVHRNISSHLVSRPPPPSLSLSLSLSLCVCVCVRERKRGRETETDRQTDTDTLTHSLTCTHILKAINIFFEARTCLPTRLLLLYCFSHRTWYKYVHRGNDALGVTTPSGARKVIEALPTYSHKLPLLLVRVC